MYMQMREYPLLFSKTTYLGCFLVVFDHFFNVIGNSFYNEDEFFEVLQQPTTNLIDARRYLRDTGEGLYIRKYDMDDPRRFAEAEYFLESDIIHNIDEYVLISEDDNHTDTFSPYPNFKKEYSVVWTPWFEKAVKKDNRWAEYAIKYYELMLDFFNSDRQCLYSNAYPKEILFKTQIHFDDFNKKLKSYRSYKEIENNYGIPFNGWVNDFCLEYWKKEKSRILEFIDNTIQHSEDLKTNKSK